jgi:hypothetical protein
MDVLVFLSMDFNNKGGRVPFFTRFLAKRVDINHISLRG